METGTSFTRALFHAKRSGCDIINMSYGEASAVLDHNNSSSRYKRLVDNLVNEHGVTFVSSAGNNGPALSTVGAPGGCYTSIIGVGAFVSGDMMEAQYALIERLPDTQFTWSSRGPTPDGHLGVSISGCGAAISPIPTYTLQKNMRMNGTSMSSPSVCGGITLLMGALRAKGMTWNPYWIKQAIEATAKPVENVHTLALGHGLLQVEKAYSWLTEKSFSENVALHRYEVHCDLPKGSGKGRTGRGIYLREPHEVTKPFETTVRSIDYLFLHF
jgi:tripeptidyl-peptidase-2